MASPNQVKCVGWKKQNDITDWNSVVKQKTQKKSNKNQTPKKIIVVNTGPNYEELQKQRRQTEKKAKIDLIKNQIKSSKTKTVTYKKNYILDQIEQANAEEDENNIQNMFDLLELEHFEEEQDIKNYIDFVENNQDIIYWLNTLDTKDTPFFIDFLRDYDFGYYAELEHMSDTNWYVVCPVCQWSVYKGVEEYTCTCNTKLIQGEIFYPLTNCTRC